MQSHVRAEQPEAQFGHLTTGDAIDIVATIAIVMLKLWNAKKGAAAAEKGKPKISAAQLRVQKGMGRWRTGETRQDLHAGLLNRFCEYRSFRCRVAIYDQARISRAG